MVYEKEVQMNLETIIYEKDDSIALITLNRPKSLNALSRQLLKELIEVLTEIEEDDTLGAVVITGAPRPDGRPCFSPGVDLKEANEKGSLVVAAWGAPEDALCNTLKAFADEIEVDLKELSAFDRVAKFPKATIAAIDGICTAGGLELAIACDMRVVSETAQINDLHMKNLGKMGGGGLQTRLPRLIGAAKTKELLWTGDPIDGKEALRIGLANRVSAPGKLIENAKELGKKVAAMPRNSIKISKAVINAGMNMTEHESLRYSDIGSMILEVTMGEKAREGYKAFTAKRKPAL
jgi:enoyl-CoA hydratase